MSLATFIFNILIDRSLSGRVIFNGLVLIYSFAYVTFELLYAGEGYYNEKSLALSYMLVLLAIIGFSLSYELPRKFKSSKKYRERSLYKKPYKITWRIMVFLLMLLKAIVAY